MTEIVDDQGEVIERCRYSPYGKLGIYDSSWNELTASALGNPYFFTGREYDPESGLYYYRARMYSQILGRFLQPDPIGYLTDANLYNFVLNDPINHVDPMGLWPKNIHDMLIRVAFPNAEEKYIKAMQRGSAYVDKNFQAVEYSYMHAMRAPNQSPAEAKHAMELFIKNAKNVAKGLYVYGFKSEAWFFVGVALHPAMDSTAPPHRNFAEWDPNNYLEVIGHFFSEGRISLEEIYETLDVMLCNLE